MTILTMNKDQDKFKTRATLLQKIKDKHDDKSWEDFVFYYENFIYILCRRMNLGHHDAEEVVQKVLMIAWKKLPDFEYDKSQNFRGWLCNVTRNSVRNFYRSVDRHRAKLENAANAHPEINESLPDIETVAEEEWKNYIAGMALNNLRGKIADNVIDVFLKLTKGGTPASVGEEMGIPPNTVSVYKKRVTAQLCKEIRRLNHELG